MFPRVEGGVYGTFLAAEAVGGLIGAFMSGKINKKLSVNQLMIFLGVSGVMLTLTPFLYQLYPNIIFLSIAPSLFNLFLTIFNIQFFSFIQRDVDNEYLGRVFGIIFTVAILFMPLGTILFTMVLHPTFVYNFLFVGVGMIALSVVFKLVYKKLRVN